jgi:hypothetical protein
LQIQELKELTHTWFQFQGLKELSHPWLPILLHCPSLIAHPWSPILHCPSLIAHPWLRIFDRAHHIAVNPGGCCVWLTATQCMDLTDCHSMHGPDWLPLNAWMDGCMDDDGWMIIQYKNQRSWVSLKNYGHSRTRSSFKNSVIQELDHSRTRSSFKNSVNCTPFHYIPHLDR